jgi:hypothetical protein
MESKIIQCVQCDAEFEFTAEEQQEYESKGYDEPKRCPDCRRRKSKFTSDNSNGQWKNKKKRHHDRYDDEN